jgi:hypothetical protein
MRGGAIPLLVWGTLLLVLYACNWAWEGRWVMAAETGFALLLIYGAAAWLWLLARDEALKPGPPRSRPAREAIPLASIAAVGTAAGVAMIAGGLVWTRFLLPMGIALLLTSLGKGAFELREQLRAVRSGEPDPPGTGP